MVLPRKHEQPLALVTPGAHFGQAGQIVAFVAHDRNALDIAQFAMAQLQSRARDFDRVIGGRLLFTQCFKNAARLASASASEFRDFHVARQRGHDVGGVRLQYAFFGARHTVLGQRGDHFEEGRADFVIQIHRRQFFLRALGQAGMDGFGKGTGKAGRRGSES